MIASNGFVGIRIDDTSGNTIGGVSAGDGNVIQNNGVGIIVLTATSARNAILGNSISGHASLGIDIDNDGVTANDPGDLDSSPRRQAELPGPDRRARRRQGTLNSAPSSAFRIEFFGNTACDASGNGEGATFLGSTSVTTDGSGNAAIALFTSAPGQFVTATATDSSNNTSEFSSCAGIEHGRQRESRRRDPAPGSGDGRITADLHTERVERGAGCVEQCCRHRRVAFQCGARLGHIFGRRMHQLDEQRRLHERHLYSSVSSPVVRSSA